MASIPIPEHIKGIIFDLDGTLADTMPVHLAAWKESGRVNGVEITDEMIMTHTGMPTVRVAAELNKEYGWSLVPEKVKADKDVAYARFKPEIGVRAIEPVYEIAVNYRGKLPMSVGTGSSHGSAMDTLTHLDVVDWFDGIVTANDVEHPKPHPETFLRCAALMGVDPKDCLVLEDGAYGIQAAEAAGMYVIDVRPYLGE